MFQPSRIVSALRPLTQANRVPAESKDSATAHSLPSTWQVVVALALVYACWSTTYLAIKIGVRDLPPGLFAGTRVSLAGICLLLILGLSGGRVLPEKGTWRSLFLVGTLLFVGGNGLITWAEKSVESGLAAVLVATVPLWMALMEALTPRGERLRFVGWLGQLMGLSGVCLLFAGRSGHGEGSYFGTGMVLASAFCWSLGSFLQRRLAHGRSPYGQAGWHMLLGGLLMTAIGLAMGEAQEIGPESINRNSVGAFFYLLIVGSLIGFVAYVWLLRHVGTLIAGTYAYVNPVLAVVLGVFWDNEPVGILMVIGLGIILAGVSLVRMGRVVARLETTA